MTLSLVEACLKRLSYSTGLIEISLSGPPGIVNNLGKMSKKGAETRVLSRGINIPCLKVLSYEGLLIRV